jgi:hypothetical protein
MCINIGIFRYWPETAKLDHILHVISGQGDQIELIPFAMSQASFDYPQHIIPITLKVHFFRVDTPLGGPLKLFVDEKKYFPLL